MNNATHVQRIGYRSALLATVSAFALIGSSMAAALAADTDRPSLWINLGWQFERDGGGQEAFAPAFVDSFTASGFSSPAKIEKALPWSYGANGGISYQPENSDWIFSASVRYGRTHGSKAFHQQTTALAGTRHINLGPIHFTATNQYENYEEVNATNIETHEILDFQAGKDLGLGLFGANSTSVLSAGVRYAQIRFGSHSKINGHPDLYLPTNLKYAAHVHVYYATNTQERSFGGLGPALSLSSSVPLAGNLSDGEIALDWGINGGLLFGKQKARGHHQTKTNYYRTAIPLFGGKYHGYHHATVPHDRSQSVTVPNLGGFAGLSLKWTNAKVSLGYRADIFFNAIDGGIDTRKNENRGFYGPFANISIGIGD